jgi:hypothetical protein
VNVVPATSLLSEILTWALPMLIAALAITFVLVWLGRREDRK